MAEFEVDVITAGESELRSLLGWLRADEALDRLVTGRITGDGRPLPGHMGTGFDILQLAVDSTLSGGALAVSLLQWRDARRARPALTLRRDDIEVEIPAGMAADAEAVRRIVDLLAAHRAEGNGGDDPAA